jgi:hypothetical protein
MKHLPHALPATEFVHRQIFLANRSRGKAGHAIVPLGRAPHVAGRRIKNEHE